MATETQVGPGSMNGWVLVTQGGATAEFAPGVMPPAAPGAFKMQTPYSDAEQLAKIYLGTNQLNAATGLAGTPLAGITSFKVSTYVDSRGYDEGSPPMIELITDSGSSTQQRRFWFYPWGKTGSQSNVMLDTWQEWDLMSPTGYWELLNTSSSNYFGNWSWVISRYSGGMKIQEPFVGDYTGSDPDGLFRAGNISGTALSIKIGAGRPSDSRYGNWWKTASDINAYADKLVIGVNGAETVFNFVPEPSTLLLLAPSVALLRRRRR